MGRRELGGVSGRFLPARPTPEVCAQGEPWVPLRSLHAAYRQDLPTGLAPDGTGPGIPAPLTPNKGPTPVTPRVRKPTSGLSRG